MRFTPAAAVLSLLALAACQGPAVAVGESSGCGKDTDCKGDRICENARCVAPPSPTTASAVIPPAPTTELRETASLVKVRVNSEPDTAQVLEEGVELCTTPCEVLYKGADAEATTPHTLTFARRGYRSETRTIRVAESPVMVRLTPRP